MVSDEAIRMARAEQANASLKQFLGPAFDVCRADYLEKLGEIAARPLTNDMRAAMEKLALGVKVIDEVRRQIEGLARGQVGQLLPPRRAGQKLAVESVFIEGHNRLNLLFRIVLVRRKMIAALHSVAAKSSTRPL